MTRLYIISRLARQNYWISFDAQYSYKTYIKRNNRNKQYLPVYLILYSNFEFMPFGLDEACQVYESSKFPYKDDPSIDRNKSEIVK